MRLEINTSQAIDSRCYPSFLLDKEVSQPGCILKRDLVISGIDWKQPQE